MLPVSRPRERRRSSVARCRERTPLQRDGTEHDLNPQKSVVYARELFGDIFCDPSAQDIETDRLSCSSACARRGDQAEKDTRHLQASSICWPCGAVKLVRTFSELSVSSHTLTVLKAEASVPLNADFSSRHARTSPSLEHLQQFAKSSCHI